MYPITEELHADSIFPALILAKYNPQVLCSCQGDDMGFSARLSAQERDLTITCLLTSSLEKVTLHKGQKGTSVRCPKSGLMQEDSGVPLC